jgi:hypothetical protein
LLIGSPRMDFLPGAVHDGGQVAPEVAILRGRIVPCEYLRREIYLHRDLQNGTPMVVEASAGPPVRVGDTVGIAVKPGAAHLFAAGSEQRLAA